ncbi:MAG: enoyl-CoA hydratase/isomerase family protein [Planctomycetota bacterium]
MSIETEVALGGAVTCIRLDRPPGNVLDAAMCDALVPAIREASVRSEARAILLSANGPHFSFGASVEEHRPGEVRGMLERFHGVFRALIESRLFLVAAIRGYCLGGGLELAAFCQRVIAHPEAKLGQPEIKLGVFAPMASLVLPERTNQAFADDLCVTGRSIGGAAALGRGLVDQLADDPESAARRWIEKHLVPLSAMAVRHAVAAVRLRFHERVLEALPRIESAYLDELMSTEDAKEGIDAFLEKRPPQWRHR